MKLLVGLSLKAFGFTVRNPRLKHMVVILGTSSPKGERKPLVSLVKVENLLVCLTFKGGYNQ